MDKMDTIISLAKRRGFIFPGSDIYGGLANSWDYGPLGVELKNNIKQLWWNRFVHKRSDMVGLDAALIMNPKVWEASGHLEEFTDPLVECKKCHHRFRADQLENTGTCPDCKGELTEAKQFNLMLKTFLGPAEEKANEVFFRPETAQAMFVNFKNVLDTTRMRVPFGIAQIGKAFRNEITPGNFIFRTREFEQMEIEYFVREEEWEQHFEHWLKEMRAWLAALGVNPNHITEVEIPDGERAHYSKRTVDFEYAFPFGQKELYGLAYRGDFDLSTHQKHSGENLQYRDPETQEEFLPHVIEPTWGVDRSVLVALLEAYQEDESADGKKRVYLKLPPIIAPYTVAVFPLMANRAELVGRARDIYDLLRENYAVAWDDRGNIGKRYYAQDEIGTPWCITVDFDTLENDTVTVRDRDTGEQDRVSIDELSAYIREGIQGER
ncbi:MAG: glycine--tRNA ligase [Candidatus Ryanbacteria bacterium CG10_big_fil_rev_8_21_14_0_10_43_42]|uniref:Glycine--tRNA ligase n=1 Tax=Candidatus Ryanbacteria bacterium CG10_big_fil_rev_8_21_14_0_10_43_42 TaxID=1974864 RepID=A0A2M8KXV7_9BACT|nr:MAG: glycine--tRNA ligase [Candidatus Ryanbacteria bacterium CG10_big_fil_rev_8_21_14_0_10_43_42]